MLRFFMVHVIIMSLPRTKTSVDGFKCFRHTSLKETLSGRQISRHSVMSSSKEDALSPDELKKRLYQTFKNKGVLDTLKAQLRNQLIQELKHPPLTGQEPVPQPVPVKSEPLLVSACNSIVADHLHSSGYEYTLSVFYPESGLCKDKVFKNKDLLQLLKIQPESALYSSLVINLIYSHALECSSKLFLTLFAFTVEKMKLIDREYENFTYSEEKMFSFQSKLDAYRREIEAQMKAEMNTKLQLFNDVEIAKVRMEEKSKFHKEFDKLKQELERTYEMKAKALMDREKNAIDRLQKQQEIEEKNVYMQRQSVLKEIETLHNREKELRMRMEAFEKTCQIHEEKVKTTEELLRRRELAVKTMEDTYDQRLKNELSRYQLDLKEDFIRRTEKLTESESRNKVETARIQKESAVIDARLEDLSRARSELKRAELDTAQQQISLLTQQKELLRERLETMNDYPSMKREKAELQGQLQLLKKQLEEAQEENQLLHPSKEQLAMQMELGRLQSARRLDEEEFDNQKQVLRAQLQSEVERCAQLRAQLIECEEKSQWMTSHAEDIKMQLHHTQQAGGPMRGHMSPWSDSPDSGMELVAEAKARIRELQKEAETLEEAYRSYQQRAVRSTISHMLPTRALSPQQAHPSHRPVSPLRKQDSHSTRKQKVSHRSHSPPNICSPSMPSYGSRDVLPLAQSRVTFSEDNHQPQATAFTDHSLHLLTEPLFLRDEALQDESSAPPRRLSSTPQSSSRTKLQREIAEGTYISCFILSKHFKK
uniref:LisH domain-containing protein n=1 Tax=Amphiprion ocellaris TaxID=80972 RepID=A0AAQ5YZV9_AMPOC